MLRMKGILVLLISILIQNRVEAQDNFVVVSPQPGDNWKYLQETINNCIAKGIKSIHFRKGVYNISKPLHCENNGKFFSLNLLGEDAAHFNDEKLEAKIVCNFKEGYAIGYQLCRSSLIKGLVIHGQGIFNDSRTKPYAGIIVDPFDRGNTSGSSGLIIRECRIFNFTTGVVISPNGKTLNAENIHVETCSIDGVKIAYATCQRQSKANTVKNLICWDKIETVFDGKTYGQGAGVMPFITGVNVAGRVKQIFNFGAQLFTTYAQGIFAEQIEQIGVIDDGFAGVTIRDSYFDFAVWVFPRYHFKGNRVKFDNVGMRYYDDKFNKRIVIEGFENFFSNCYSDLPLLMQESTITESKSTNFYLNFNCIPESRTKVVRHSDLSTWQWLDMQYLNKEEKYVECSKPVKVKKGDYLVGGQSWNVFARVVGQKGNRILIDDVSDGIKTGQYHMGISGITLEKVTVRY